MFEKDAWVAHEDVVDEIRKLHKSKGKYEPDENSHIRALEKRKGTGKPGLDGNLMRCRNCDDYIKEEEEYIRAAVRMNVLFPQGDAKGEKHPAHRTRIVNVHTNCQGGKTRKCPKCKAPYRNWDYHKKEHGGHVPAVKSSIEKEAHCGECLEDIECIAGCTLEHTKLRGKTRIKHSDKCSLRPGQIIGRPVGQPSDTRKRTGKKKDIARCKLCNKKIEFNRTDDGTSWVDKTGSDACKPDKYGISFAHRPKKEVAASVYIAQDGGGGGASGGGDGGGGASAGGDSGGGDSGGGDAYGGGAPDTGAGGESLSTEPEGEGKQDVFGPSKDTSGSVTCPKCGDNCYSLNTNGGVIWSCAACGWISRGRKRKRKSSRIWGKMASWEKISEDSRSTRLKQRNKSLEENGDTTTVIRTLPDNGVQLRKLNNQNDYDFESDLQGNCVRWHGPDSERKNGSFNCPNLYSTRDKDNIPQLSFTMHHGELCGSCRGTSRKISDDYESGYYDDDDEWHDTRMTEDPCEDCNGTGVDPNKPKTTLHIDSVARRGDAAPYDSEVDSLMRLAHEHAKENGFTHISYQGGNPIHIDDIHPILKKYREAAKQLPAHVYIEDRGGVGFYEGEEGKTYANPGNLRIHTSNPIVNPSGETATGQKGIDQLANELADVMDGGNRVEQDKKVRLDRVDIHRADISKKRFDISFGNRDLNQHFRSFTSLDDMDVKPIISFKHGADWTPGTLTPVHKYTRPTEGYIHIPSNLRTNSAVHSEEGLHARNYKLWQGPLTDQDDDVYKVTFSQDQANNLLKADFGREEDKVDNKPPTMSIKGTIPWSNITRVSHDKDQVLPLPDITPHGVTVHTPTHLYVPISTDSYSTRDLMTSLTDRHEAHEATSTPTGLSPHHLVLRVPYRKGDWEEHHSLGSAVQYKVPILETRPDESQPYRVQRIPQHPKFDKSEYDVFKVLNSKGQWSPLDKDPSASAYGNSGIEPATDDDIRSLVPSTGFIHVPVEHRDSVTGSVYQDDGIHPYHATSYGSDRSWNTVFRLHPQDEEDRTTLSGHPRPSRNDIFKVDLTNLHQSGQLYVHNDRYGRDPVSLSIGGPIPWSDVTLHHKAEIPAAHPVLKQLLGRKYKAFKIVFPAGSIVGPIMDPNDPDDPNHTDNETKAGDLHAIQELKIKGELQRLYEPRDPGSAKR